MAKYNDISKTGNNLTDINSILESIDNIISTRIGERPFNRAFGSRIEDFLFRPFTFSISRLILSELISSISKWEHRVDVISLTDVTMNPDKRIYEVKLYLKLVGMDQPFEVNKVFRPKGN